ncbi:MAG: nucleotidyltransferase domain-containing protein [Anaerolineales bacterium]
MPPLQLPLPVSQALDELKRLLTSLYGDRLRAIYLYGSYARGTARPDSDVDVLIALRGEVRPREELRRLSKTLSDLCLQHDVLIATYPVPENWVHERQNPLFENIRREGIRL